MRVNCFLFFLLGIFPSLSWGYPSVSSPGAAATRYYSQENKAKEAADLVIFELKNAVKNHEIEIETIQERLTQQENSSEHLHTQLLKEMESQKESQCNALTAVEMKSGQLKEQLLHVEKQAQALSSTTSHLAEDIKQTADKTNENIAALSDLQKQFQRLQSQLEAQNQSINSLESAVQILMELIQSNVDTSSEQNLKKSSKSYRVESGDTLEKIARSHRLTIKRLKEYNGLKNDRINIGQILKIPS